MTRASANTSPSAKQEWIDVPSAFADGRGRPLFHMPIRKAELGDPGLANLFFRETRGGGYEYSCRAFLLEHLAPGDAFLDVGAHRGVYSLTAWFSHPGEVEVLAVEPHPDNVEGFKAWAGRNKVNSTMRLVQAAAADAEGRALMRLDSSMGHRLTAPESAEGGADRSIQVQAVSLDGLLGEQPLTAPGRIYLKIDVEGAEPAVLKGATGLLRSGRVAAVIWEKGAAYEKDPGKSRFLAALQMLQDLGFDHFRFCCEDLGGPLVPYVPFSGECNVVSLERGFVRRESYPRPFGPVLPSPARILPKYTRKETEDYTRRLIRAGAADAARWARPEGLIRNAHFRAGVAALQVPPGASVLDLGCGLMALAVYLRGGTYTPADIVARSRDCLVLDLNQSPPPKGEWDWAAALHLLEFIHDPEGLLRDLAGSCRNLVLTYHPVEAVPASERLAAGFFNDFSRQDLLDVLGRAGWTPVREDRLLAEILITCQNKDRT